MFRAHGFGLVEQIESRDDAIGNDSPNRRPRQVGRRIGWRVRRSPRRPGPNAARRDRKAERRARAIKQPVADIGGQASERRIALIGEAAHPRNVVGNDGTGNLGSKIGDRHELRGHRAFGRPVQSVPLCESARDGTSSSLSPTSPTSLPMVKPNRCSVSMVPQRAPVGSIASASSRQDSAARLAALAKRFDAPAMAGIPNRTSGSLRSPSWHTLRIERLRHRTIR